MRKFRLSEQRIILLIFSAGMILRILYILGTDITERQHDVFSFEEMKGHAGYIGYFLENAKLPDFDPREIFQFYHPPLHHIIAAIWMKLNLLAGFEFKQAAENIQILTMLYSGAFLVLTEKIFRLTGLKGKGLITAFTFLAFHPTFIILSGSINNDMLSILMMQGAFLYALKWGESQRIKDIVPAAVFLGAGMMSKLSAGMAAAGIGFIFMVRFLQNSGKRLRMLPGFAVFAIICFPLALWWSVRNAVLFDVPIGYVPSLGDASHQYIGHYSLFERLLDFSPYQFRSIYVAWGEPYFEHNVFIGLLKTATFGEQTLSDPKGAIYVVAQILFVLSAAAALASVYWIGRTFFSSKLISDRLQRTFLVVVFLTFLAAYVQFCFAYPHTCTQNIRYATPLVWISALAIGKGIGSNKIAGKVTMIFTGLFALSSVLFYVMLTLK
ncbi:hypothetical protein EOM86_01065 [Candidatus Nomurabacteria bacterium]|nr:hypothetical protein [Candidatus Nomurabacteria bacterium]